MKQDILRKLPSIDQLMGSSKIIRLTEVYGRGAVLNAARVTIDEARSRIINGTVSPDDISIESISLNMENYLIHRYSHSLHRAVNATGIILHTGLGRAMLAQDAVDQISEVIKSYCTLATDLDTGQRGSRDVHVSSLICELTGAEAATVVNNNAAATMIILNSLAKGKEIIVSRGQLVEIGGSFRMPDVMETSGAILHEVGTTNKTHLRDYKNAINENTGAILRVHTSNYRIVGFTEEPSIQELVELAGKYNLPVIDDLGSGALIDLAEYGLETEPLVQESIRAGADVACFSGDKLIGGPQCGIIVGKKEAIQRIKKNPLARAFRVGKMTVAGLEATLRLFLNRDKLNERHPTYRMLSLTPEIIQPRVQAVADKLRSTVSGRAEIQVVGGASQVGSGSVPVEILPSRLLSIKPVDVSADTFAKELRRYQPSVFTRIQKDAVLFDFRTIQPDEDDLVVQAIIDTLMKEDNFS